MMQFCVLALYCASLPGNKFHNGILFGIGEVCGMFISALLLLSLKDVTAYQMSQVCLAVSYFTLIFFPSPGLLT